MARTFMFLAGLNGLLAVALGAFGAHGLRTMLADAPDAARRLDWWETAARYQMYHALALGLLSCLAGRLAWGGLAVGGWAFIVGIVLFSGTLYVMTFTDRQGLGAIVPAGGVAFLIGWVVAVWAALRMGRG